MNKMKMKDDKLPLLVKFGYGGIEGSVSSVWILVYLYLMFFLTDVVKLNPTVAGMILMIATLWDAVSDPIIGVISDRSKLKWGRRRPFFLIAVLPFGIATWLLFTDFQLGSTLNTVYYIVIVIVFYTFFTMLNVPHSALGAEMTQDYTERMSLVSFRMGWGQFLGIFAAAIPLILAEMFAESLGSEAAGWSAMAASFGLFAILPILLTWHTSRGYELFPETPDFKLSDVINIVRKNRSFRYTIGIWTFGIGATVLLSSMMVYFMAYIMEFDEDASGLAFSVMFAVGLVYIPIVNWLVKKAGKRIGFITFGAIWALISGILMIMVSGPESGLLFWIVLVTGLAVASCLVYMMGWAMISDITEVDELVNGQRREGLFFGVMAFIQKLATAITLQIMGIILTWVGYQPDVAQTETAKLGIRVLTAEGPALLMIIAIIFAYYLPLTREKHEQLRNLLKLKAENKAHDITQVQDLI